MKKTAIRIKIGSFWAGEMVFFLLIALYFCGGVLLFPGSWFSFFDSHPKVYRKLLVFVAVAAVILGLALVEWARRDKTFGRSFLLRSIDSWKSHSAIWVTGLFIVFGSLWTASSILRFESMGAGFDMAIFTQAIWNTTQGAWFYSSIKGGICLLGDHFAPLLVVFALPYSMLPEPVLLLAIQAFSAAACVFPLARIVRRSGQSPVWAVLYCLMFVLYLPVRNSVRFDFHPEVVAMPLLFWAFVFLQEKRVRLASLFLMLALMAKENIATVAFAFGLYACIKKEKQPGFGIFWMTASIVYFFVVIHFWIPRLSGAPYFYLDGNFIEWLRGGWQPFSAHIFRSSTFSYLVKIYGPLAFTSFLAPAPFLLTLPTLMQNLLSRSETSRSIFFQYTATLTPFVFISSVIFVAKIRSCRKYWAYLLLLTSVLTSGTPEVYSMRRMWIAITPHTKRVAEILRTIPSSFSLRTHEFYAPHAANRKELHIYENEHPKEGGAWKARHTDLVAIDRQILKNGFDNSLKALEQDDFLPFFSENGFIIFKNKNTHVQLDEAFKKTRF